MALDKFFLRTVVGGLMMGHGLQKLNGSFGGPGLKGMEKGMKSLGMYPPEYQARAVALSETIGGGLTALGFLSPLGPAMIMGTMAVAIKKVHLKNGLWNSNKGYEFNLTLIAASFALAADGPGLLSVDWMLGKQRKGLNWALAAAALGAGAAAVALQIGDQLAPEGPEARAADDDGLTQEPPSVASGRDEPDGPAPDLSEPHLSEQYRSDPNGSDQHGSEQHGSDEDNSEAYS
ncbi:MAG: DoxX family protein [Acidimicrobiales bacterium]